MAVEFGGEEHVDGVARVAELTEAVVFSGDAAFGFGGVIGDVLQFVCRAEEN